MAIWRRSLAPAAALKGGRSAGCSRRCLWQTRTVIAQDASRLKEEISNFMTANASNCETGALLFALSKGVPTEELSSVVGLLQKSHFKNKIGCLSDHSSRETLTCALAVWTSTHKNDKCTIFRSELTGKPHIAVGREIMPSLLKQRSQPEMDLPMANKSWSDMWQHNSGRQSQEIPEDLTKATDVNRIVYFSDNAPEGLIASLDRHFAKSTKLGAMASSTPFTTGRPYTLFLNDSIHSEGAVGIAFSEFATKTIDTKLDYGSWAPLGVPFPVTDAQGNIILTLSGRPATRLLLDHLDAKAKAAGTVIGKDQEYYIGILPAKPDDSAVRPPRDASTIYKIGSGDPSKGAMAIDTERSIVAGDWVQFYYQSGSPSESQVKLPKDSFNILNSVEITENSNINGSSFTMLTEHGFTTQDKGNPPQTWRCSVPGSSISQSL